MYRKILILPEYRRFQHILWCSSPHDELREYELNTITYCVNCAPYLALRVLQTIAHDDCDGFEGVRHALTHQTYVNDICNGADTLHKVLKLQSDLILVLNKSGLELKKWASNTPFVLAAMEADVWSDWTVGNQSTRHRVASWRRLFLLCITYCSRPYLRNLAFYHL